VVGLTKTARMLALSASMALLFSSANNAAAANSLAVGAKAKTQVTAVPVNLPENFNWKSRSTILDLRSRQVRLNEALLAEPYQPNMDIYGAIEDGKPWWGLAGSAVFGQGSHSIIGPAEESRYVMNPYMLVGLNPACGGNWSPNNLSERDLEDRNFPYFWLPQSITFDAPGAREAVQYNISEFEQRASQTGKSNGTQVSEFSLVAYNARDFGYNWIWLDTNESQNVANDTKGVDYPVRITQMIHCGGSCGYPGNCNNMSPFIKEIDRCRFTALPARAAVRLWKERPATVQQRADFTVYINMR
jgi:hypothetical protein